MITVAAARRYYRNDVAHDQNHVLRVLNNAPKITETEDANFPVLETVVLLHDTARSDQDQLGADHALEGARQARHILIGQLPEFFEAVCHAICAHRFRVDTPPQTIEAKILYDADKLDSIGAVGVARASAYSGSNQRPLWAEEDENQYTPWQEFNDKLREVKDNLQTQSARYLAEQRHIFMVQFFEQMAVEI